MSNLRAIGRLLLVAVANACLYPVGLATRIPGWFGWAPLSRRLGARVQGLWCRVNAWILGLRVEVESGNEEGAQSSDGADASSGTSIPQCLVVANHCSYLDILVLGSLYPCCFVAKREISGWPLIGPLARSVGTIFVDQSRPRDVLRVGEEMRTALESGLSVVLFAEGRAHRGREVLPFHPALFAGAARKSIPCLPVALHYASPGVRWGTAWTVCWWGGMDLPRHFWRLAGMPGGVRVTVRPARGPVVDGDRRHLAKAVRSALQARFEPMSQGPVPPDNPWPELDPNAAP